MGATISIEDAMSSPLTIRPWPVICLGRKYTSDGITLRFNQYHLPGEEATYDIVNALTNETVFSVRHPSSTVSTLPKILQNADGDPIVSIQRDTSIFYPRDNVYADLAQSQVLVHIIHSSSTDLQVSFTNVSTNTICTLGLVGQAWRNQYGYIWTCEGELKQDSVRHIIAKIGKPGSLYLNVFDPHLSQYDVHVSPKVDLALIAVLCIAMNERL